MEGMTTLNLMSAHELVRLMAKRERLLRRLAKCESKLRLAMGRWATEVTGVHERMLFSFKGSPAVLIGWAYDDLPVDLTEVPECIGAYIGDPRTLDDPRHFTGTELMVSDFSAKDSGHEEN